MGRLAAVLAPVVVMPWLGCASEDGTPTTVDMPPAAASDQPTFAPGEKPRDPSMVLQPSDLPPPAVPDTAP